MPCFQYISTWDNFIYFSYKKVPDSDEIPFGSNARIEHALTNTWIHGSKGNISYTVTANAG